MIPAPDLPPAQVAALRVLAVQSLALALPFATPAQLPKYQRHIPESTLLHQLVRDGYPAFVEHLAREERTLPGHVRKEFDEFLRCGRLEYGFLRVRCEQCHAERLVAFSCKRRGFCPSCGVRRMTESARLLAEDLFGARPIRQWVLSFPFPLRFLFSARPEAIGPVLGVVYRAIAGFLADQARVPRTETQCGAVTLIQRFGSALNLNIHFHMLFLDGVYVKREGPPRFQLARAPTAKELTRVAEKIARRIGRHLERKGYLQRDEEQGWLTDAAAGDPLDSLRISSITYRIALGPQAGRKVMTLQTAPADLDPLGRDTGKAGGFSLHAGVAVRAGESAKLERLCRYITRPALSEKRLSLTRDGRVRYTLKTPYRDGTTHVVFEPLDFLARLAALVPSPRAHLTRFHGVFAPNARLRPQVTHVKKRKAQDADGERTPAERRAAMTWAQRLKRVFGIDVEQCARCGGKARIVAAVEEPDAVRQILEHFEKKGALPQAHYLPAPRGPPGQPHVLVG
ncbi:transposase [Pseudomonas aeruginosa]|uniref:transposase n=1 Tax=Pseudomonas aeruginosa TaxID=287 RepID=UPI003FD4BAFB